MSLKIAILASGSGTNAQRIIELSRAGILRAQVCLLFSNRPKCVAIHKARSAGIETESLDHTLYADREEFDARAVEILRKSGAELIVLAGYMRLLSKYFLDTFHMRVINIHPALLPAFPGIHGARDAVEYGVKISGATVHFVEEKMDSGPVIIQAAVPVMAGESAESLQNRIHAMEYRIYPQAIQWLADGRIKIDGRNVLLSGSDKNLADKPAEGFVWPPLEEGF